MKIHQVEIKRFRGIDALTWRPPGKVACLIGPGDSTKTTILEAIELALTTRFDLTLSDADFFGLDTSKPIEITVTVGALPDALQADTKYGLHLRGWHPEEGLQDEPADGVERVLSVRLTVDEHLEPRWEIWNQRLERPQGISGTDRGALGVARIGASAAWHLTWSRRSALSRLTEARGEAEPYLANARRAARQVVGAAELPTLNEVAQRVEDRAKELGVAPTQRFRPGLSPLSISLRQGPLSLHDGDVPLSGAGMGTQRLAAIAVQQLSITEGAILLFDEVEHGLEPHRIRHLLRMLRDDQGLGQVLMTSHSPVAIAELRASELCVAQNQNGAIEVKSVSEDLQDVVRASAEALLSRAVIVCEGKTEIGICRALDRVWQNQGQLPFAHRGIYPIDGAGTNGPRRALGLKQLGYRTALFRDADVELSAQERTDLHSACVDIIEWDDGQNTEGRTCLDLPWPAMQKLVNVACEERGENAIKQSLTEKLGRNVKDEAFTTMELCEWLNAGILDEQLRKAIAECSTLKSREWFKRIDLGERLGEVVAEALPEIPDTDLATKVCAIKSWVHGD